MFDDILKQIKKMERMQISVPIETDENGYLDKECPNKECLYQFKVNADDWTNIFLDEAVYCPKCRHTAIADSWWTTEQIEDAQEQAISHVHGLFDDALKKGAQAFNRSQPKKGFLQLSLQVSGTARKHFILPIHAQKELQLEIKCEQCNANYAVIGSAFFCPCCGHNSVKRTYDDAIKKVEIKISNLHLIRKAFSDSNMLDEGEITCLSLIETGLTDCVVAFQRFSEESYRHRSSGKTVPFNAFQRLETGGGLWKDLYSEGYEDWLTPNELTELNRYFQQRHLLAHSEGIVDQKYIDKAADNSYRVGQRIIVKEKDVSRTIFLIQKVVAKIRSLV